MYSVITLVLVVLGVTYAAFAVLMMLQFRSYCELVAKSSGRGHENQEFWNADEGGNNVFQLEQWRKLRTGEYKKLTDPVLVAKGESLVRKLALSCWLAIGLVTTVALIELWRR
jgi:hypothetical protein